MIQLLRKAFGAIDSMLDPDKKRRRSIPVRQDQPAVIQETSRQEERPYRPPEERPIAVPAAPRRYEDRLAEATTVEDCMSLYQDSPRGSPEEDRAASKAAKIATSFSDWTTILDMSDIETEVGKRAVERLRNLAGTFDEWRELSEKIGSDASLAATAAQCKASMLAKAESLDEWLRVYGDWPSGSAEKARAADNIAKLAQSDDDWDTATDGLQDDDPLRGKRKEWELAQADDLSTLERLYNGLAADDPLEAALIEKLNARDDSLDDWIEIYKNHGSKDAFDEAVFGKMLSIASTPSDWIAIVEAAEDCHDDDAKKALEALGRAEWTQDEWIELRDDASDGSSPQQLAFEKLLGFEKTVPEILRFYLDYCEDRDEDSDVAVTILDKLFELTTPQEAAIIAELAGDHGELQSRAEEKAKPADEGSEKAETT